jgi:hypothetical protein
MGEGRMGKRESSGNRRKGEGSESEREGDDSDDYFVPCDHFLLFPPKLKRSKAKKKRLMCRW